MKKLISFAAIIGMLALPAGAQTAAWAVHKPGRFLAVPAVYATNTLQITNLTTGASVGTNVAGTTFTNPANIRVTVTNGAWGASTPLLQDVSLYALADGRGAWAEMATNNVYTWLPSYATLSATMKAQSGANAAVTFVCTPLYNGVNEATEAGDLWTFSFTPTASATQTFSTNAPLYKWPGAAKLRLKRIVNADTDATSAVIITDVSLNQFGSP